MKFYFEYLLLFIYCFNTFGLEISSEKLLDSKYIVCIDGGGSKTSMKIIDKKGNSVDLYKNHTQYDSITGACSNINFVGIDAFEKVLDHLFDDLYVTNAKIPFNNIISSCLLIGGFSGGSPVNLKKAQEKFQLKGFKTDQLFLTSDAELSLELIKPTGIILISGTGSIAFGLENNQKFRTGGFGKLLNDGGNGYSMGISAIRSALEYEHGYGNFTTLHRYIKELYNVQKVHDLIPPIHSGEILQDKIASLSKIIFENYKTDVICNNIVQDTIEHLSSLIIDTLKRMHSKDINIVLIGGIFNQGDLLTNQILSNTKLISFLNNTGKSITLEDRSKDNIAFEVAKMLINKNLQLNN